MQLDALRELYPDAPKAGGWVEIYLTSLQLDGNYSPAQLRELADFTERIERDFTNWYHEVRKLDPEMSEEPVNAFWHDFCKGMTPLEAYNYSGMYGRN